MTRSVIKENLHSIEILDDIFRKVTYIIRFRWTNIFLEYM